MEINMQMKLGILLFLVLCLAGTFSLNAQVNGFLVNDNAAPLSENRYAKVEGSPYQFKDWMDGILFEKDEPFKHPKVNYNGRTGRFEVKVDDGKIIEINPLLYRRIIVQTEDESYPFSNKWDEENPVYYREIFAGEKVAFLEKFETELETNDVASYGVSSTSTRFVEKRNTYLWLDGKLMEVKQNKRKIFEAIGSSKLEKYAKKQKLNVKRDDELAAVLRYYEEELMK